MTNSNFVLAPSSSNVEVGTITANVSELFALPEPAMEYFLEQAGFCMSLDLGTASFSHSFRYPQPVFEMLAEVANHCMSTGSLTAT